MYWEVHLLIWSCIFQEPDYLRYQSLYVMALDDILNNNTALQAFLGKLRFLLYVSVVCSLLAFNLKCQNDLQRIRELVIFTFNYFFNFNILQDHLIEECLSKNLSMLEIIFCYD